MDSTDGLLLSRLSPHSFRVTAITDLLTQGVTLEDLQCLTQLRIGTPSLLMYIRSERGRKEK